VSPSGVPPAPGGVAPRGVTPPAEPGASEPFAWGDFTWLQGSNRQKSALLDSKYFTGSFLADLNFNYSLNHPNDHTNVGSTATFREGELNLSFVGAGGDFHYKHARGRIMLQLGTRATGVPRNDASPDRGQFVLRDAYRYITEAYGGYHWDVLHGINLDAGIFMSYIGLLSYANFENWNYQPSYTSDNTPWFFHGLRLQIFPTDRFKEELWLVDGWQSYALFAAMPGIGSQTLWRPREWVSIVANLYLGKDTLTYNTTCSATATAPPTAACTPSAPSPPNPSARLRFHSDNSLLIRYFNMPGRSLVTKAAFSLTGDLGFESGAGVSPFGESHLPAQNFIAGMLYHRLWFLEDHVGWTVGGGVMHNPGRYLVLPPTGNANPLTGGFPFTMNPGDPFNAWDLSTAIQYMPDEYSTWGIELVRRSASVPYFAGPGGVTSATGTWPGGGFDPSYRPDLRTTETRIIASMLFRM
jgi:hypothetical protein